MRKELRGFKGSEGGIAFLLGGSWRSYGFGVEALKKHGFFEKNLWEMISWSCGL